MNGCNLQIGGSCIINGKEYKGRNVSVVNGKVVIDGNVVSEEQNVIINIHSSTVRILSSDGNINISDSEVSDCSTTSGNLIIHGDVYGNVETRSGNITISGPVAGSVTSRSGNISHK